jgi:hypothetical protein
LLEAVEVMVSNGQAVPLVVALPGGRSSATVSRDSPILTLAVTDLKVLYNKYFYGFCCV